LAAVALDRSLGAAESRDPTPNRCRDPVPDEIWNEAARHYKEPALAQLLLAISLTNVYNRFNVATRQVGLDPVFVDTRREAVMVSKMEKLAKAKRPRRRFTDEFKAGAVALVLDQHRTIAEVARDLDLTRSALDKWVEHAGADRSNGKTGLTTAEREELTALRRENRQLRMERDLLKKWAAFFAKETT